MLGFIDFIKSILLKLKEFSIVW